MKNLFLVFIFLSLVSTYGCQTHKTSPQASTEIKEGKFKVKVKPKVLPLHITLLDFPEDTQSKLTKLFQKQGMSAHAVTSKDKTVIQQELDHILTQSNKNHVVLLGSLFQLAQQELQDTLDVKVTDEALLTIVTSLRTSVTHMQNNNRGIFLTFIPEQPAELIHTENTLITLKALQEEMINSLLKWNVCLSLVKVPYKFIHDPQELSIPSFISNLTNEEQPSLIYQIDSKGESLALEEYPTESPKIHFKYIRPGQNSSPI